MAFAGTLKTGADFNILFRFIITPLFLFSGVFFPITQLPPWLQRVATLTPLYHGVELVRGLVLHAIDARSAVVHALYLMAMVALGVAAARWTFTRRLRA
jgi:lipooligosaccharide transport system permease protein